MSAKKTKHKKLLLTSLVCEFMDDNFDENSTTKALSIIDKLSQETNVVFVRGKLEIWACAIIYISSKEMQSTSDLPSDDLLEDVCNYFKTRRGLVLKRSERIEEIINVNDDFFEDYFDKIYEIFNNGNVEKAFEMLDDIGEDDPKYFTSLVYRSMILGDLNKYNESDEFLKKAILLKAKNNYDDPFIVIDYDDYYLLADIGFDFYDERDFDNAIKFFDLSLELNHHQPEVLFCKALALDEIGKTKEAINELDNAIQVNPNEGRFWIIKANCLFDLQEYDDALRCYDKAIEFFPDDDDLLFAKSLCLSQKSNLSSELFDEDGDLDYSEDQLNIDKALVFINTDEIDMAIKCLNNVSKKNHGDLRYLLAMGKLKFTQEDYDEALKYFDKCLEIDDELEEAWLFKVIIYGSFKDDDAFGEAIDNLYQLNPKLISNLNVHLDN